MLHLTLGMQHLMQPEGFAMEKCIVLNVSICEVVLDKDGNSLQCMMIKHATAAATRLASDAHVIPS